MTAPAHPSEAELHAFIDAELDASRHAEIAAILQADPVLAARVAAYQSDRDRLRLAYQALPEDAPPAAWVAQIEAGLAARGKTRLTRRLAIGGGAAGLALAASVAALVYWQRSQDHTILAQAEAARDGRMTGQLADNASLQAPPVRDALLQSVTGIHVRAPDLERFGFRLAQIELFGPPGRGAAQLRYADPRSRLLTIFVRPSDGSVRFDITRRGELRICVWQDDVVGTVIMAPVSPAEMMHIAASAYTDLNL